MIDCSWWLWCMTKISSISVRITASSITLYSRSRWWFGWYLAVLWCMATTYPCLVHDFGEKWHDARKEKAINMGSWIIIRTQCYIIFNPLDLPQWCFLFDFFRDTFTLSDMILARINGNCIRHSIIIYDWKRKAPSYSRYNIKSRNTIPSYPLFYMHLNDIVQYYKRVKEITKITVLMMVLYTIIHLHSRKFAKH